MTQYMLTVHGTVDDPTEYDPETLQPMFETVERFNQKARDAGIWVFAGGLEPIEVSTTVDNTGARADRHGRPVRRGQGVGRRLLGLRAARPRRRPGVGDRGAPRPAPGRSRSGPSRTSRVTVADGLAAAIERIYREEYGRIVASLVRRFGDIDIAEEAAGEALLVAVEKWPVDGVPPNPGGWLTTTAGNRRHRQDPPRVPPRRQAPGGTDDRSTTPPTSRPASSRTTGCG